MHCMNINENWYNFFHFNLVYFRADKYPLDSADEVKNMAGMQEVLRLVKIAVMYKCHRIIIILFENKIFTHYL